MMDQVFIGRWFLAGVCALSLGTAGHAAQIQSAADMVRISAGPFLMGSNDGPEDERPQHQVTLGEFFIDRTPVTNEQFAQFLNAVGPKGPGGENYFDVDDNDARIHRREGKWLADKGSEAHPVVEASWHGGLAYCRRLGKRLPTEPEWEKAARGVAKDGREDLLREQIRGTRGGGQDSRPEELTTTHRGRHVSRNFRSGRHNIGFRCAR